MFADTYAGRRVLVTGHTGFKGSWLASWLLGLGAEVGGLSLDLPSTPNNFEVLGLEKRLRHYVGDVRDAARVAAVMADFRPEIVFHLAAQALVRRSGHDIHHQRCRDAERARVHPPLSVGPRGGHGHQRQMLPERRVDLGLSGE